MLGIYIIDFQTYYDTFDEAYEEAKAGKLIGFIYFASNFSSATEDVGENRNLASLGSFENREINIYLDNTDQQKLLFMKRKLYAAYIKYTESLMTDCRLPRKLGNIP